MDTSTLTVLDETEAVLQAIQSSVAVRELAPAAAWRGIDETQHFVQFYEADDYLVEQLADFVADGLQAGEACVVVATPEHRAGLEARLQSLGPDLVGPRTEGRYVAHDPHDTLAAFMVNGTPNPKRFAAAVGNLLEPATAGGRKVRIFGEMVALLWAEGNRPAALRLEELWNELHRRQAFTLFCAYPLAGFGPEKSEHNLAHVCAAHSCALPAESYSGLSEANDRLRTIIQLQQKANLLESQIAERRAIEADLLATRDELEVQVEDLRRLHEMSIGLHNSLDLEPVLQEVLRATLEMQATDMGLLSLSDGDGDELQLKVHTGFNAEFLQRVDRMPAGAGACGACFRERRRVVVEDAEGDPLFDHYREAARLAGSHACHSTPLINRSGKIIGVLSAHFRAPHRPSERECRMMDLYARLAADIIDNATLHHQVQAELERREHLLERERVARAEAEKANRLKDDFLATVSHELRTPLNAILGWTHMLRGGGLDEETVGHAVETIERNAKSQAQLVEDILDASRVITGKLHLTIAPVDLAAVINAAIDAVQLAADARDVRLMVTLDTGARHISGDAGRLQQVIWNLLSNAIKFTPAGGRVEVRLERAGDQFEIKVSDTGQGINPDFLPFIFDRFRQADGSSTRSHGGLGLGLAIVRHLVELHGGSVRAESAGPGAGATFVIRLPQSAPTEREVEPDRDESEAVVACSALAAPTGSVSPPEAAASLEGLRLLIVDDDADSLRLMGVMLADRKAVVQKASSAAEALEALRWYKPDVLVSDLAMPGEDGYSLIAKLRALEAGQPRQTPAVALTAYVRVQDRTRALAAGFNMFVPKPVEPAELIAAIASLTSPAANTAARL